MKVQFLVLLSLVFLLLNCNKEGNEPIQFRGDCIPADSQNGLIAFYPFSNGALVDESGNGNDLINLTSATPAEDREGNPNCAFQFDNMSGDSEFLTNTGANFLNGLSAFSVALWYYPADTVRAPGNFEVLLSRGEASHCPDRRGEWSVGLYDCRRAVFGHNNSVWAKRIANGTNCQIEIIAISNKWHHVVAVYNNDTFKLYFDGVLQGTKTGFANCNNLHVALDSGDLFIGKWFTGTIDDVLIYNREISATEVADLWESGACCE